jgi:hypothetical protein
MQHKKQKRMEDENALARAATLQCNNATQQCNKGMEKFHEDGDKFLFLKDYVQGSCTFPSHKPKRMGIRHKNKFLEPSDAFLSLSQRHQ